MGFEEILFVIGKVVDWMGGIGYVWIWGEIWIVVFKVLLIIGSEVSVIGWDGLIFNVVLWEEILK